MSLPGRMSTSYECFIAIEGSLDNILFSGSRGLSPYVVLLSLLAIPCTVLYRISTHRRTIDLGRGTRFKSNLIRIAFRPRYHQT